MSAARSDQTRSLIQHARENLYRGIDLPTLKPGELVWRPKGRQLNKFRGLQLSGSWQSWLMRRWFVLDIQVYIFVLTKYFSILSELELNLNLLGLNS
jgi:hypothetical protein